MDSLTPASRRCRSARDLPTSGRRAIWKFWGTTLWGLFIFAAMFVGQVAVIV